jgi:hypothetical protein
MACAIGATTAAASLARDHRRPQAIGLQAVGGAANLGCHAGGGHLLGHDRELMLDGLELADRSTELLPLVGKGHGHLQHAFERADDLRAAVTTAPSSRGNASQPSARSTMVDAIGTGRA